jgi:hypothetical protein
MRRHLERAIHLTSEPSLSLPRLHSKPITLERESSDFTFPGKIA